MFQPEKFHVIETLPDGSMVEIRAQRPEDKEAILEEVRHASADTLYHRFFAVKRALSEQEQHFFFDVDFVNHVVLLAVATTNGQPRIVGGARFIVTEPGKAEVAFSVVDALPAPWARRRADASHRGDRPRRRRPGIVRRGSCRQRFDAGCVRAQRADHGDATRRHDHPRLDALSRGVTVSRPARRAPPRQSLHLTSVVSSVLSPFGL